MKKIKIGIFGPKGRMGESILKQISNRTYQMKNSIEWHKFQAGFTWPT